MSPPALFGGFAGTTPMFDSSLAYMSGLRFRLPEPIQRPGLAPECRRGLSVLARAVSRRAYGSWTTPDLTETRAVASASVASRGEHSVGVRNSFFEARFLARRCLGLHFTRR